MLRFNNPVFPSNVAQTTKVTVDGDQKGFELLEPDSRQKATAAASNLLLVPTEAGDKPVSRSTKCLISLRATPGNTVSKWAVIRGSFIMQTPRSPAP